MGYRFVLAALSAALIMTGCAEHSVTDAPTEFAAGPTQVNVSHVVTRADDGSTVYVTIDGQNAGVLTAGDSMEFHVPAGKHRIGGYVQTLLGLGRVTIAPIDVTTTDQEVKKVAYSVTRAKPGFAEETPAPVPAAAAPAVKDAPEAKQPVTGA